MFSKRSGLIVVSTVLVTIGVVTRTQGGDVRPMSAIETNALRLVDSSGRIRAELKLDDDGVAGLTFNGPDGAARLILTAMDDGGALKCTAKNGSGFTLFTAEESSLITVTDHGETRLVVGQMLGEPFIGFQTEGSDKMSRIALLSN